MNYIIPAGMQRIFIGIPVDKSSQKAINKLLKGVKTPDREVRWVPESNRHLTLAFLGDRPVSEVEDLARQFDKTYQWLKHFQYRLSALARFPDPRGRIIALTGEPAAPLENVFQITRGLLRRNKFEFDQKKFRPHVTLARIRNPKHLKTTFDQAIKIELDMSSITLYQSTLTKSGSIYSVLTETRLS
jgi:2'-5' RNA ligase